VVKIGADQLFGEFARLTDMEQKRKIVPPIYFLAAILLMVALHYFLPLARILNPPSTYVGALPMIAGIVISALASRSFAKAGTPVIPFERSTVLVRGGLFRISRNPMYLGLILALIGTAMLFGTAGPWLPIPVFVWIIRTNFIAGEERFLEEIFGAEYLEYKKSVRRWL
jgi:protein-S-isoprenylcysteine O-methyltransferase Ste14